MRVGNKYKTTIFYAICCISLAAGCTHKKSQSSAKRPRASASVAALHQAKLRHNSKKAFFKFSVRSHTYDCIDDPAVDGVGVFVQNLRGGGMFRVDCKTGGDKKAIHNIELQGAMGPKLKPVRFKFIRHRKFVPCIWNPVECIGKATG